MLGSELSSKKLIENWITERLSQRQIFLGNLPPCPYALEALVNSDIHIVESTSQDVFQMTALTLTQFYSMPFKMHVIAISDWQELTVNQVAQFVKHQRDLFYKKDLWLLYDHPESSEVVQGYNFNQGQLLVFMVQRLSDLVLAAKSLKNKDYYKQWPIDYYEEVVLLREKYYEKYLSEQNLDLSL